jgi:hypothetical protein
VRKVFCASCHFFIRRSPAAGIKVTEVRSVPVRTVERNSRAFERQPPGERAQARRQDVLDWLESTEWRGGNKRCFVCAERQVVPERVGGGAWGLLEGVCRRTNFGCRVVDFSSRTLNQCLPFPHSPGGACGTQPGRCRRMMMTGAHSRVSTWGGA